MEKLVELIQSMSKSEKRYFKMNAGMQKGEKNYVELLDAIESQEKYNETALLKKFAKKAFINNFSKTGFSKSKVLWGHICHCSCNGQESFIRSESPQR